MKEKRANDRESASLEGTLYKHDVEQLKRESIHSYKKQKQNSLYPSNEISEDIENMSSNSEESSLSSSSDISLEKPKPRHRRGGKRNISSKCAETSKPDNDQSEAKRKYPVLYIAIIIAFIVIGVGFYFYYYNLTKPTKSDINIDDLMSDIENKYNNQSPETYKIVKSAIKTAVLKDSTPGILILVASAEAKDVSKQLASHIASVVSKPPVFIEWNSLKTPQALKKDIDDTIEKNLSSNELKAVVVNELDRLPFEAAMIFHSYCDHENAPFKRALYVMTVSSNKKILPSSNKDLEILAFDHLSSVWGDSGEDQVSSLINRLTGYVAGVSA